LYLGGLGADPHDDDVGVEIDPPVFVERGEANDLGDVTEEVLPLAPLLDALVPLLRRRA
jgi:hypothetical protein